MCLVPIGGIIWQVRHQSLTPPSLSTISPWQQSPRSHLQHRPQPCSRYELPGTGARFRGHGCSVISPVAGHFSFAICNLQRSALAVCLRSW